MVLQMYKTAIAKFVWPFRKMLRNDVRVYILSYFDKSNASFVKRIQYVNDNTYNPCFIISGRFIVNVGLYQPVSCSC
jgi:hypothetical protein